MTTTTQSRSRNSLVVGVTVLATLVAIALVVWLLTRSENGVGQASPTPTVSSSPTVAATPSPTATATAAPATAWEWEVHELPAGPARGAASIGDRWVALDGLEAWTSADGAAWDAATVDDTPQEGPGTIFMGPVASIGDAYYSVGNWFSGTDAVHPVVWRSEDGTEWTQVPPSDPWGYLANDAASDGAQLAVAGNEFSFGEGHVWTSPDGVSWTERTSDGGPSTMNAIHGDADGFVSVGYRLDEDGNSLPAIWHSADGESWTDAELPPTDGPVAMLDVTRLPDGRYIGLGMLGIGIDAGEFTVWYADDPSTWTDAGVLAGGRTPGLLLAVDSGVLSIIGGADGPSVRFSADGTTWEDLPNFVQPDRLAFANAAATDGSSILIVGSTLEADANFAWIGRPITE